MKIKVAIASLAVAVVVVAAFAFSKPTTNTTLYYKSEVDYQRIQYGTTSTDLIERSIEQNSGSLFKNINSWQTNPVSFTSTIDMTKYIGAVSFDEDDVADGGGDGQLTAQEVLNELYNTFASTHAMPSSLTVGTAVISVTAATAAH